MLEEKAKPRRDCARESKRENDFTGAVM